MVLCSASQTYQYHRLTKTYHSLIYEPLHRKRGTDTPTLLRSAAKMKALAREPGDSLKYPLIQGGSRMTSSQKLGVFTQTIFSSSYKAREEGLYHERARE